MKVIYLIVKCNSDIFASTREISQDIAEMSAVGNEGWNIQEVTLSITYGRYQTQERITFESMKCKKSSKHSYIFRMLNSEYKTRMKTIPQNYKWKTLQENVTLKFVYFTSKLTFSHKIPHLMWKFVCNFFRATCDSRKTVCSRGGLFFTLENSRLKMNKNTFFTLF